MKSIRRILEMLDECTIQRKKSIAEILQEIGTASSGNHGHAGRPHEVGGSGSGGELSQMSKEDLIKAIKTIDPKDRPASPYFREYERRNLNVVGRSSAVSVKEPESDIGGFEKQLSPLHRTKAIAQMNEPHSISGKFQTRKKYVEDSIAAGAIVGTKEGQPALMFKDGRYMLQKHISKTAIDYAEYLLKTGNNK
jgi:hypothetical protein